MRGVVGVVVLGVLASSASASAAGVGFVGIEGLGLGRATVQPIERLLERAIGDHVGTELLSPDQITARLLDPSLERLRGCNGNTTCLVDLGGVLEIDLVIYGTLTRLGENFVIVLKSIDVAAGGESNRIRYELAGAEDQLVNAIRTAAGLLLEPAGIRGTIVFEDLPLDAVVEIDGDVVGAFDGEPLDVRVGRHAVTITTPGSTPGALLVDVPRDEVTRIDARTAVAASVATRQHGILSRWWPVGTLGAGGGLLVAGTVLGGLTLAEENAYEDAFRTRSSSAEELRESSNRGRSLARATNITLGTGAVLAGIGGLAWFLQEDPPGAFDDFLFEWRRPMLLGVGGAALAGGATFAFLTAREENQFEDSFRHQPGDGAALRESLDRGRSYALWTNLLLTVGIVVTSAGLADLIFLD